MTTILLNRQGTDIVDLSTTQTGSPETTIMTKDALLLGEKDYRFAVTELSIPMQNIDMFGYQTAQTQELFTIQRRNYRSTLTDFSIQQANFETAVNTGVVPTVAGYQFFSDMIQAEEAQREGGEDFQDDDQAANADRIAAIRLNLKALFSVSPLEGYEGVSTYSLNRGRKFYDVNQFVKSLSDFGKVFNTFLLAAGIDNWHFGNKEGDPALINNNQFNHVDRYQFLRFYLSSDGNLIISGDRFFWDNFMLRFTNTGAALLGIDTSLLTDRTLVVTTDIVNATFRQVVPAPDVRAGENVIIEGDNTTTVLNLSPISIFQSSECRVKCTVESHLPMQSSIEIRDEKETNNREICSAFFLNDVRTNCVWDATGALANYSIESTVFAGQFPMIHQKSRIRQWNRLLTAYNLQFFRFFINIHYRYFDDATGTWKIRIQRVTVDPNDYWSMKIRFVSDE